MFNEKYEVRDSGINELQPTLQLTTKIESKLIIPSLMPDEFLGGYAGRVCKLNSFTTHDSLRNHYFEKHISLNPKHAKQTLLIYLADDLQLQDKYLFKHHTVLKFRQILGNSKRNEFDAYKIFGCAIKADQTSCAFCEQCVAEDISHHGFSYWKTQHQLHGFDYCYKHENEPLKYALGNEFLRHSPNWHLASGNFSPLSLDIANKNNEFILKYRRIVREYLDMDFQLPPSGLNTHLNYIIQTDEWKARWNADIKSISSFISMQFPKEWLYQHFPNFKNFREEFIPGFDNLHTLSISSTKNLLLAMASILDESEFWSFRKYIKSHKPFRGIPKERDPEILAAFNLNGKSIVRTAKSLNVSYDGLRRRLKKIRNSQYQ